MLFGIDSNWSNWEILDVYTPQSKNDRLYTLILQIIKQKLIIQKMNGILKN